ncbi:MAG: TonB-dependent receptor [Elusimicrobia bacterium]|nr:TonB-dependent receptor [Candidatus Liberimonas magnetica]
MFFKKATVLESLFYILAGAGLCAINGEAKEISSEDILFMNVGVVTASKTEQRISEAPAVMYIVTAEDIKLSGATQLGEALTMVPGLNIRHGTAGSMHIGGLRGLDKLPMNKILLLVNGMPWGPGTYQDGLFTSLPVALNEIDRIEVMKGPGSLLYGANAMAGVINVITKSLKDTEGGLASVTGGEYNTYLGSLRYGGAINDKIDYRISGFYDQRDNYGRPAYSSNPTQQRYSGRVAVDYNINNNSKLSLWGGGSHAVKSEIEYESTGVMNFAGHGNSLANLQYKVNKPDILITAYTIDQDLRGGYSFGSTTQSTGESMTKRSKLEAQNTVNLFERDTLVWGAATEQNIYDTALDGKKYQNQSGVYFDNTYKITSWFTLNGGMRYDKRDETPDPFYANRLSLMFYPWGKNHRFLITQGLAYRNPDFIESYYYTRIYVTPTLYYDVSGHPSLKPEKMQSYEASYRGMIADVCIEVNAYVMNVKDFIFTNTTSIWPVPGMTIPRTIDFANGGEVQVTGYEAELKYLFTKWLSGLVNYTYIEQKELTANPSADFRTFLMNTPKNTANAKLTASFNNGITCSLSVNYVDATVWKYVSSWGGGGNAAAYTIANTYLGYKIASGTELSLAIADLFDTKYDEYPIANQKIGRRATLTLSQEF